MHAVRSLSLTFILQSYLPFRAKRFDKSAFFLIVYKIRTRNDIRFPGKTVSK